MPDYEPKEEARLLDLRDVARLLSVSKATANRLLREGDFPPHAEIGGQKRWFREDVFDWVRGKMKAQQAAEAPEGTN